MALPSNDSYCKNEKNHGLKRWAPEPLRKRRSAIKRRTEILRGVYVFLGVLAIISSVFVASQVGTKEGMFIIKGISVVWASITAAVSTGLMTAFGISQKSNNFMNAWRILDNAINKYEMGSEYNIDKVIDACNEAEKLIGNVGFQKNG